MSHVGPFHHSEYSRSSEGKRPLDAGSAGFSVDMVPSFWTDEISNVGDSISNVGFEPSRIPNEAVQDNSAISPGIDELRGIWNTWRTWWSSCASR